MALRKGERKSRVPIVILCARAYWNLIYRNKLFRQQFLCKVWGRVSLCCTHASILSVYRFVCVANMYTYSRSLFRCLSASRFKYQKGYQVKASTYIPPATLARLPHHSLTITTLYGKHHHPSASSSFAFRFTPRLVGYMRANARCFPFYNMCTRVVLEVQVVDRPQTI